MGSYENISGDKDSLFCEGLSVVAVGESAVRVGNAVGFKVGPSRISIGETTPWVGFVVLVLVAMPLGAIVGSKDGDTAIGGLLVYVNVGDTVWPLLGACCDERYVGEGEFILLLLSITLPPFFPFFKAFFSFFSRFSDFSDLSLFFPPFCFFPFFSFFPALPFFTDFPLFFSESSDVSEEELDSSSHS